MPRPKGNGLGHGGPAKGASVWGGARGMPTDDRRGRPLGVKTGDGKAAQARRLFNESLVDVAERIRAMALDPTHPQHLQAALAVMNRCGMHEKSGVEHSGDGGGPMRLEIEIVRPGQDEGAGSI